MKRFIPLFLVTLSGCALFGGGGGSEIVRAKGYSADTPQEWSEADSGGESDRAYRLKSGNLVTLTSSCGKSAKRTLPQLTGTLLLGMRNVKYEKQTKLQVQGAEALHSTVRAHYQEKPFCLEIVVLKRSGCVFDFTLMSPTAVSKEEQNEFLAYVRSFQYGKD